MKTRPLCARALGWYNDFRLAGVLRKEGTRREAKTKEDEKKDVVLCSVWPAIAAAAALAGDEGDEVGLSSGGLLNALALVVFLGVTRWIEC